MPSSLSCAIALCAAFLIPSAHAFELKSADFADGGTLGSKQLFKGFGCSGADLSPQLSWSDPPAGTRSFAVTIYDPDAPTGSGWWHWVVYDIPANVRSLHAGVGKAGRLPAGARHGRNDFGAQAFGGACPPPGDKPHRYIATVVALKVDKLLAPAAPSGAMVGFLLHANGIGSATLTATYGR